MAEKKVKEKEEEKEEKEQPVMYASKLRICNPYQNVVIGDIPKVLIIDSFWQSQIDAGIVVKC